MTDQSKPIEPPLLTEDRIRDLMRIPVDAKGECRLDGNQRLVFMARQIEAEVRAAIATDRASRSVAEDRELPGPSGDVPSDFQEGQWWLATLDELVAHDDDGKRAVATVRNLMRTAHAQAAPKVEAPAVAEDQSDGREVIRLWNERARGYGFDGVAGMLNAMRHKAATIPQASATPPHPPAAPQAATDDMTQFKAAYEVACSASNGSQLGVARHVWKAARALATPPQPASPDLGECDKCGTAYSFDPTDGGSICVRCMRDKLDRFAAAPASPDVAKLKEDFTAYARNQSTSTHARTRYWLAQWAQLASRAIAAATQAKAAQHRPLNRAEAAEVDEKVGLSELPPIRIDLQTFGMLEKRAAANGVIVQAEVRRILYAALAAQPAQASGAGVAGARVHDFASQPSVEESLAALVADQQSRAAHPTPAPAAVQEPEA